MGGGKTLIAINEIMRSFKELYGTRDKSKGCLVVVCSMDLMLTWINEIKNKCNFPHSRIFAYTEGRKFPNIPDEVLVITLTEFF